MRRAAVERDRAKRVQNLFNAQRIDGSPFEGETGRFRKTWRIGGCMNSHCYLCHSEKWFQQPDRQRMRAQADWCDWLTGDAA